MFSDMRNAMSSNSRRRRRIFSGRLNCVSAVRLASPEHELGPAIASAADGVVSSRRKSIAAGLIARRQRSPRLHSLSCVEEVSKVVRTLSHARVFSDQKLCAVSADVNLMPKFDKSSTSLLHSVLTIVVCRLHYYFSRIEADANPIVKISGEK